MFNTNQYSVCRFTAEIVLLLYTRQSLLNGHYGVASYDSNRPIGLMPVAIATNGHLPTS